MSADLLRVEGLEVRFKTRDGGAIRAVDGVDLVQAERQTIGIVGESGCGKSTLARAVLRLVSPSAGRVLFRGEDLSTLPPTRLRAVRRDIQLVFQDPLASLDPRWTVGRTLAEPFVIHGVGTPVERAERVAELLRIVGLGPEAAPRFPHEFSGGQRQRIGIARAIALRPALVILDEPVSALDVSIQAQILNLLEDLKAELGLAYLFISHDLAVVRSVSDRVAVMYLGRIVESGPADAVFERPAHPYTEALLAAIPRPDPARKRPPYVPGEPASPEHPPPGCPFHSRCLHAFDRCRSEPPAVRTVGLGHEVRCHLHSEA